MSYSSPQGFTSLPSRFLPALNNPKLQEYSPTCYYGYAEGSDQVVDPMSIMKFMWTALTRKKEKGILILEDLSKGSNPYSHFDKTEVMPPEAFSAAFRFIGHFHGVWWQVLNGKGKL